MERTNLLQPLEAPSSRYAASYDPGQRRQPHPIHRRQSRRERGVRDSLKAHAISEAITFFLLFAVVLAALAISFGALLSGSGGQAIKDAHAPPTANVAIREF